MLTVEGLCKRYGEITVADGLAFQVARGECLGVIGPNGAGKTSLFNLLDGSQRADAGRVLLDGAEVTAMPRWRRARRGITRAFQVPQPMAAMTVFENVLVPATFAAGLHGSAADTAARDVLERCGLAAQGDTLAGGLRLLDRKRLELAKALAGRPKLLLLDEIAGGLTEPEVLELVALVKQIRVGLAVIWIEHVAHALLAVADRLLVMHFGRMLAEGEPAATMASQEVREIYLGIAVEADA